MMSKKTFKPVSEYKEASVLQGADVYISVEDATGILSMTSMKMEESDTMQTEVNMSMFYKSRDLLRKIAKGVLKSGITATAENELFERFE